VLGWSQIDLINNTYFKWFTHFLAFVFAAAEHISAPFSIAGHQMGSNQSMTKSFYKHCPHHSYTYAVGNIMQDFPITQMFG